MFCTVSCIFFTAAMYGSLTLGFVSSENTSKDQKSLILEVISKITITGLICYCMAEGGVFIGRVLKFPSEETYLFPRYRKSFCTAASGVNDCSLNYWLRLPI